MLNLECDVPTHPQSCTQRGMAPAKKAPGPSDFIIFILSISQTGMGVFQAFQPGRLSLKDMKEWLTFLKRHRKTYLSVSKHGQLGSLSGLQSNCKKNKIVYRIPSCSFDNFLSISNDRPTAVWGWFDDASTRYTSADNSMKSMCSVKDVFDCFIDNIQGSPVFDPSILGDLITPDIRARTYHLIWKNIYM